MKTITSSLSVLLFATTAALGCGSDSNGPPEDITGSYAAAQFFTTSATDQGRDELAAGSTVSLTLSGSGTTTGHLHVAASTGSPAFDADLTGTWARTGNTVHFTQSADTFIRNMTFTVSGVAPTGTRLTGDQVFSGTRVQLTLAKVAG